jgi:DNA polymerase-3 subunit gamma/tau
MPVKMGGEEWNVLIGQLKLGGMARMLAEHCALQRQDGAIMELCVPEAHKHLVETAYVEKLKTALEDRLGKKLRLQVVIGATHGKTPAEREEKERQRKQADAVASVEQDPFVRELVENFDGRVVESSIKPVQP